MQVAVTKVKTNHSGNSAITLAKYQAKGVYALLAYSRKNIPRSEGKLEIVALDTIKLITIIQKKRAPIRSLNPW